jgi:hypothetical protein
VSREKLCSGREGAGSKHDTDGRPSPPAATVKKPRLPRASGGESMASTMQFPGALTRRLLSTEGDRVTAVPCCDNAPQRRQSSTSAESVCKELPRDSSESAPRYQPESMPYVKAVSGLLSPRRRRGRFPPSPSPGKPVSLVPARSIAAPIGRSRDWLGPQILNCK